MGKDTAIAWTDHTFNPWWGCTKVSPGCQHCYAETLAARFAAGMWGPTGRRRVMSEHYWHDPIRWHRAAVKAGRRARVFCASMADVFEDNPQVAAARARLFALVEVTPALDWLLLTKRPQNILRLLPPAWQAAPPPNVWYGTSVEDERRAAERIPALLAVPGSVRFLSCEPLLGPVNLAPYLAGLHWVITGGESGPQARPADLAWFRTIRDACLGAGVAYFHKQNGGRGADKGGKLLDGQAWQQWPVVGEVTALQTKGAELCL